MLELHSPIIYEILYRLDLNSICQMRLVSLDLNNLINEYFWKKLCAGNNIEQNFYDKTYAWLYSVYNRRVKYLVRLFEGPWDPLCQFQKEYYGTHENSRFSSKPAPKNIFGEGRINYIYDEESDKLIRLHIASDLDSLTNWDPDHIDHTLVKRDDTGHYSYKQVDNVTYFIRYTPFGAINVGFSTNINEHYRYMHVNYPKYYVGEVQKGMRSGSGILKFDCGFEIAYDGWNDPITYNMNNVERVPGELPITPDATIAVLRSMLISYIEYCDENTYVKKIINAVEVPIIPVSQ